MYPSPSLSMVYLYSSVATIALYVSA